MGRQDNVEIFEDTQRLYSSNERLISAIKNSSAAQECFTGMGRYWYGPEHRVYQKPAQTVISPKRTLEAAAPYVYAGRKVCVLNFASATNPGGGVVKGCTGRSDLPLFYTLSKPEGRACMGEILRTPSACP